MTTAEATSQSNEIGMDVGRCRKGITGASVGLKAPQDSSVPRLRGDAGSACGEPQWGTEESQASSGRPLLPKTTPKFLFL